MSSEAVQAAPATDKQSLAEKRPEASIYIGNLSYQTRESELNDLCEKIGKVYKTFPTILNHRKGLSRVSEMMICFFWSVFSNAIL